MQSFVDVKLQLNAPKISSKNVQQCWLPFVRSICSPCWELLGVVGWCWMKFGFDQNYWEYGIKASIVLGDDGWCWKRLARSPYKIRLAHALAFSGRNFHQGIKLPTLISLGGRQPLMVLYRNYCIGLTTIS